MNLTGEALVVYTAEGINFKGAILNDIKKLLFSIGDLIIIEEQTMGWLFYFSDPIQIESIFDAIPVYDGTPPIYFETSIAIAILKSMKGDDSAICRWSSKIGIRQ